MEIPSGLVGQHQLDVVGHVVEVDLTADVLRQVYLPLLQRIFDSAGDSRRQFVALAGIPGSGKSTFAAVLSLVAERVLGAGRLVVVGMDGWHWPNAELNRRMTIDEVGNPIPLCQRKGSPESFDATSLIAAMDALAVVDRDVSLPIYDRRSHEPIADGLVVPADAKIILLEGNYLFLDDMPWRQVSSRFTMKLFLECDRALARRRVIDRHVRGGLNQEQAEQKYESNDRFNTDIVMAMTGCRSGELIIEPPPFGVPKNGAPE